MIELKQSKRPITNTLFPIQTSSNLPMPRIFPIKTFMRLIKRTPECIGIGMRITRDIFTEMTFTAIEKKKMGRPSEKPNIEAEEKAKLFSKDENMKHKLSTSVGLDWLFTGSGYIWKGFSETKMKEKTIKLYKETGLDTKEIETKAFLDEDLNTLSKFESVPSSTVEIIATNKEILKYRQWAINAEFIEFNPDEIIHAKFLSLDGDPYGFTPMISSAQVIDTLSAIKDYHHVFFKNNGVPDMMFKMPKEMASSPNFKLVEQQLREYKKPENKHGIMLFAGEIEKEELNKWDKDMEFRQHAIYLTGVLAFAFNMPPDTISSILGVDIKGTALGSDLEDSGYQDNIIAAQEYWENILNTQLFNPIFGVDIHFKRKFKQDQIRITQNQAMFLPVMESIFKHKIPVTDEYIIKQLNIPREHLKDGVIDRSVEEIEQTGISPFSKPAKSENQQKASNEKKMEQQTQENIKPPIGV